MNAAPRLTIHVGLHKTGTTPIQHYFRRHVEDLRQYGILYPTAGRPTWTELLGHHDIPWSLTRENMEAPEALFGRLRAEIDAAGARDVVLSSEEFDRMTPAAIATLADALPYQTRIAFYYRRQSEIVQGLYGTEVLHGGERRSLADYADAFRGPLDYGRFASDWARVYGKEAITALRYDPATFPGRNIVPHFLAAMDLAGPPGDGEHFHYNVSMPWYVVMGILRLRNLGVSEATIARVAASLEIIFRPQRPTLALWSPREAHDFDLRFDDANRRFLAEFAPGAPPIEPCPLEGESRFQEERAGPIPELEPLLRVVAEHVWVKETGESSDDWKPR
jgi:hypothetical protein